MNRDNQGRAISERQNRDEKKPRIAGFFLKLVGERGFEPPTHWSQTSCATKLRYSPISCLLLYMVLRPMSM